jgi:hypothetical protein
MSRWLVMLYAAILLAGAATAATAAATEPVMPTRPLGVAVLWWPAEHEATLQARQHPLESCLAARMRELASEIDIVPQREIRELLFPLLEPSTQPASEQEFAALIARSDVHARLLARGLRFLVAFSSLTAPGADQGASFCLVGYTGPACLGFFWRGEETSFNAALWALDTATVSGRETGRAEGVTTTPVFLLPIVIPARTAEAACRDLGERLVLAMRRATSR